MKKIPILLIYSRVLIGSVIVVLSVLQPVHSRGVIVALIALGLLTDVFDGIIARRLGISTEQLRRLDSGVDLVFWLMVLIATCIISPSFYENNIYRIIMVLSLEALAYLLCFIRFKKEVATHAILSKVWAITIFAAMMQAVATGHAGWAFDVCYYTGIITRIEIMLIILLIPRWTNDVPSVYHAILLRQGRLIKRNKWFNG